MPREAEARGPDTVAGGDCELPEAGPLVRLTVSLGRSLWRLGPAWAVLAGALVSGTSLLRADGLLGLAGALVLADSAWGAVWVPIAGWAERSRIRTGATPNPPERAGGPGQSHWLIPYVQPDSPVARLRSMLPEARWHDVLVAIALMGGLAVLLGLPAVLLSLVVLLVSAWALFVGQWGAQPALPRALLAVGLPWLLGMAWGYGPAGLSSVVLTGAGGVPWAGLALGGAFTLLEWGSQRAYWSCASQGRGVWLGQFAVLLTLVALRLPGGSALVAALFLPPAWYLLRARGATGPVQPAAILALCGPWWWAAMLASSLVMVL
jgi:hypothetical protein